MSQLNDKSKDGDHRAGRTEESEDTVPTGQKPKGSRRFGRRSLALAVGLLVLTSASIATAVTILEQTESDPYSEVLPQDRGAAIERLGADIALPPGGSFDALVDVDWTEDERGLAGTLAFNAWCQWTGQWIDAQVAGDSESSRKALSVMEGVPSWPQLVAVDAGGVVAGLTGVAAAAGAEDIDTVVTNYQTNCIAVDIDRDARLAERWQPPAGWDSDPEALCAELTEAVKAPEPTDPYEYELWIADRNEYDRSCGNADNS